MKTQSVRLSQFIGDIRRRWITRALQQGAAVCIILFVLLGILLFSLDRLFSLSPFFRTIGILAGFAVVFAAAAKLVIRPFMSRPGDRQIALYIEEKFPGLEDRLNSAVELDETLSHRQRDILIDRLIADAERQAQHINLSTIIDRRKAQVLSFTAYGMLLAFLLFTYALRDEIGFIAPGATYSLNPASEDLQEIVRITPGDAQIEKGESQEIIAELRRLEDDGVVLHYRAGTGDWQKIPMEQGIDQPLYLYQLASIQETVSYYIELDGMRSPEYTLAIYEFPQVSQIDLRYAYPAYTGLPDKVEENTGNIRGLAGSTVTLTITATGSTVSGELVVNETGRIPLKPMDDGTFSGNITIREHGTYTVMLTDRQGEHNKFPEQYRITPVDDEQPLITITDPKRDVRVNPVEEVLVAATVEDDYGLTRFQLKYSVNGEDEQVIDLAGQISGKATELSGAHLFYLEDLTLEPGDIISYYVEAEDNFHKGEPSATDMYFVEVTPFDNTYSQVNNQQDGSSGQQSGQQGGSQMVMSEQMIIAATWKLYQTRNGKTPSEYAESLSALVQAQENLRDEILDRINSTAFAYEMVTDDESRAIADLLRAAVKEMDSAANELRANRLQEALKPEQRALNNLLKADAKNKERRVQMSRSGQSGSSGSQQSEERMTELMDLELDIDRDKYEIQQQSQNQQSQEADEALEKVRELAQRQQLLADQNRERMLQEDNRRELDRLQREQEELRQEAEDLANRMRQMARNNPQLSRQQQDQMERITESMRQAEQDMKNGNTQQSLSRQRQALDDLDRLQQDMRYSAADNAREMLDSFTEQFDRFAQQEERLAEDIQDTLDRSRQNNGAMPAREDLKQLLEKRENTIDNLRTLENQAQAIEEQTREEDPETSTSLRNLQTSMEREELAENLQESAASLRNGWLSHSQQVEGEISQSIENLREQVSALDGAMPVTEEERLSQSLDETREMLARYRDIMSQAQRARQEQQQESSDQAQAGRTGGEQQDQQQDQSGQNRQQSPAGQQQQSARQQGSQQQSQQGSQQSGQQGGQQQSASQQGSRPGQQQGGSQQQAGGRGGDNTLEQVERLNDQFDRLLESMENDYEDYSDLRQTVDNARHTFNPRITGELLDEQAAEHFQRNVFDPLSQIEMSLLKQLEAMESEKKLYSTRKSEIPPEYRALVDAYFESIAK